MSRAAALGALGPALLGAVGCFDVHGVDPGPHVIDDFDDGDLQPADPAFGPWTCATFATAGNPTCALDTGYQSDRSISFFLEATIVDPPDGINQYGGAYVATFADTPQDFSRFGELVFDAVLESGDPPLPSSTELDVDLGCSTALADDGTVQHDLMVIQKADYASSWQTRTLAIADFTTPYYLSTHIVGGPAACLQRVDSIAFTVNPLLPDGQSASLKLHLDGVLLR